jgi:hypothetical protein
LDINTSIVSRSTLNSPRFSSAGTYVYGVTNSPTWNQSCGSYTNNNVTAPDGTTSAGTYNLSSTCASWDVYQTISGLTNGRVYTIGMWVKLGTATNFCLVVNNTGAWNTIGGKAFTSSDGLSTGKWTHISYTFAATATGAINLHLGYHAETAVTQQTAGTVFIWNIEMTEFSSTWIGNVEDEIRLPGSSIWTSRGNVGIGTTNPLYRLQLGNLTGTSTATPEILSLGGTYSNSPGSNVKLRVYDDGAASGGMSVSAGQMEVNTWSSGKIAFYRGTTQSAIIDANGNLGIATSSPVYKLDVVGDVFNNSFRVYSNNNSGPAITIQNNATGGKAWHLISNGSSNAEGAGKLQYWNSTDSFTAFTLGYTSSIISNLYTPLYVSGNVGIGSSTPAFKLDVNGAIGVGGLRFLDLSTNYFRIFEPAGNIAIYLGNGADPANYYDNTTHVFRNRGGSSAYALINSNGNLGIGTTSVTDKLSIVNGSISLSDSYKLYNGSSNDSVGIYFSNTLQANIAGYNGIIFRSSATNISSQTERMRITNGGNVGIGTTTPSASLHINSTTAGATLLRTDGTSGTLFSVVDDLSDSLMSVNNSAGLPVLEVFADDRIVAGQYGQNDFVVVNNKVGIGTNNPVAKLQVTSSTSIPSAIFMGGNVGIGTTNPVGKLDVRAGSGGEIIFGSYDANYTVRVQSGDQLNFYNGASAGAAYINYAGGATVLSQNLHVEKATGGTTGLVRIKADGNLGIGTTFPTAKVDTLGVRIGRDFSIANRATVRLDSNGTSYPSDVLFGHTAVANETSWTGIYWSLSSRAAADSNRFYFYRGSGNPAPNNSEAIIMTFDPNLNVGIGTTVPSALLDVSGSLKCAGKFVQNSTTQSITGTNQTLTLNVAAAAVHIVSMTSGATITTISYSNRDNNPSVNTLMLVVKYAGTASITFTSVIWANGVAPTLTATNGFADVFMLTSYQGGAGTPVWIGTVVAQALVSTNL